MNIIAESILRIFNKYIENYKKPRRYGIAELLYPSEIHMVMHIGDNQGMHMAELARIADVTRGAVSQLVAKLEGKGLVVKVENIENSSKTVPVLTNKGKVAYYAHEQHHETLNHDIFEFFEGISDREFSLVEEFLGHLESMVKRLG